MLRGLVRSLDWFIPVPDATPLDRLNLLNASRLITRVIEEDMGW